jgi:hypothetical protein
MMRIISNYFLDTFRLLGLKLSFRFVIIAFLLLLNKIIMEHMIQLVNN